MRASQTPARTILDVQFVDEKGRSNHSGFDLKHKGAFGVAQIKPGEKKRLEQANVDTGESAADLSSKYTGRWVDEAVEVVVAKPSPGDTPSVPYMLLVQQVSDGWMAIIFFSEWLFFSAPKQHQDSDASVRDAHGTCDSSRDAASCRV